MNDLIHSIFFKDRSVMYLFSQPFDIQIHTENFITKLHSYLLGDVRILYQPIL